MIHLVKLILYQKKIRRGELIRKLKRFIQGE